MLTWHAGTHIPEPAYVVLSRMFPFQSPCLILSVNQKLTVSVRVASQWVFKNLFLVPRAQLEAHRTMPGVLHGPRVWNSNPHACTPSPPMHRVISPANQMLSILYSAWSLNNATGKCCELKSWGLEIRKHLYPTLVSVSILTPCVSLKPSHRRLSLMSLSKITLFLNMCYSRAEDISWL